MFAKILYILMCFTSFTLNTAMIQSGVISQGQGPTVMLGGINQKNNLANSLAMSNVSGKQKLKNGAIITLTNANGKNHENIIVTKNEQGNQEEHLLKNHLHGNYRIIPMSDYLDEILDHYRTHTVPENVIAKLLVRMHSALVHHFGEDKFRMEFNGQINLANFRVMTTMVEDGLGVENAVITFRDDGEQNDDGCQKLNAMLAMSPQQINDQNAKTETSDIVWIFGSVIHKLLFRVYPLELPTWYAQQHTDEVESDPDFKLAPNQKSPKCQFGEREKHYIAELKTVVKMLLKSSDSGEAQIQAFEQVPDTKYYKSLYETMKFQCLRISPQKRTTLSIITRTMVDILNGAHRPGKTDSNRVWPRIFTN